MTTDDYATIRSRLDHPQVVVWDPCAVTLAEDHPEWPAPSDRSATLLTMAEFSLPTTVRLASLALQLILPDVEANHPDASVVRAPMRLVISWLCGDSMSTEGIRSGGESLATYRQEEIFGFRSALESCVFQLATAIDAKRPTNAAESVHAIAINHGDGDFLMNWWARCRALLPIADVTTAEIEWGDLELPPRPLADDLPGDGG